MELAPKGSGGKMFTIIDDDAHNCFVTNSAEENFFKLQDGDVGEVLGIVDDIGRSSNPERSYLVNFSREDEESPKNIFRVHIADLAV